MRHNQSTFEVVRDIATILENLTKGESVAIRLQRHGDGALLNWESSKGTPCGWSETSSAMKAAYYAKNKYHQESNSIVVSVNNNTNVIDQ